MMQVAAHRLNFPEPRLISVTPNSRKAGVPESAGCCPPSLHLFRLPVVRASIRIQRTEEPRRLNDLPQTFQAALLDPNYRLTKQRPST